MLDFHMKHYFQNAFKCLHEKHCFHNELLHMFIFLFKAAIAKFVFGVSLFHFEALELHNK